MLDTALGIIAPHHCYGCGKIGSPLCVDCKLHITEEPFAGCAACLGAAGVHGVCKKCRVPYGDAWCVGIGSDLLMGVIHGYKFSRAKAAYGPLVDLLDGCIPQLPQGTTVVPIPTIRQHIRQRGYDHMQLIARELAARRGALYNPLLARRAQTIQLGGTRAQRRQQASKAFACTEMLSPDTYYLLIDDVMTTGATLEYAAKALKQAGAARVGIAAALRQPLD